MKEKGLTKLAISILTIGFIGAFGCGEITDDELSGQSSNESKITEKINGSYSDLFADESNMRFDEEDNGSALTISSELQGSLPVPNWYRSRSSQSRHIEIDTVGNETIAYVTITRTVDGIFNVDEDSDGDVDYDKEFTDEIYREATFVKSGSDWVLSELTPAQFTNVDPGDPTVEIISVLVSKKVDDEWVPVWPADGVPLTDPTHKFLFPDEIPTFNPDVEVKVEAEITNSNGASYCYLHHKHHNNPNRGVREFMYDDGESENDEAIDNIFTGTYIIGSTTAFFHAGVDCLDEGTIQNEDDPYNANGWGMLYRVVEAE